MLKRWAVAAMAVGCLAPVGRAEADRGDGLNDLIAPGAEVTKVTAGFFFVEGPADDGDGNLYFTDIPNGRINIWTADGELETFVAKSGRANGLMFDAAGNLIACEMGNARVTSIDPEGNVTVLADQFAGAPFNSPNDVWIDPAGGIYFTDPNYSRNRELPQDGEHVYYIRPDRSEVVRVVDDLVRPNGVIGTPDGKTLYIADHGDGRTFAYDIGEGGALAGRREFAPQRSDGVTMDEHGNIYLTSDVVTVYSPAGEALGTIETPLTPANLTIGGPDGMTLFITARTTLFSLQMQVHGTKRP